MEGSQFITSYESYYSIWIISTPSCRTVNVRLRAELLLGMLTVVFIICSPKRNKLWAWAAWNLVPRYMGCSLNKRSLEEAFLYIWMSVLPSTRYICRKSSLQKRKWLLCNSLPCGGLQPVIWLDCRRLPNVLLSVAVSLQFLAIPKEVRS